MHQTWHTRSVSTKTYRSLNLESVFIFEKHANTPTQYHAIGYSFLNVQIYQKTNIDQLYKWQSTIIALQMCPWVIHLISINIYLTISGSKSKGININVNKLCEIMELNLAFYIICSFIIHMSSKMHISALIGLNLNSDCLKVL